MIANPQRGQTVQVWYRKELREYMPYHGRMQRRWLRLRWIC